MNFAKWGVSGRKLKAMSEGRDFSGMKDVWYVLIDVWVHYLTQEKKSSVINVLFGTVSVFSSTQIFKTTGNVLLKKKKSEISS